VVFGSDACQSSNIRPDDENFPFGLSSVSKSFELFQVTSVRTSQQHVRTPFSVQQIKGFPFQTQIWEDSCNHPDDVVISSGRYPKEWQQSGHQSTLSGRSVLIMKIACNRSATVWTLRQHCSDVALFRKEFQRIWKVGCTVVRFDALSYRPDAA
jgi:hypothetical protein